MTIMTDLYTYAKIPRALKPGLNALKNYMSKYYELHREYIEETGECPKPEYKHMEWIIAKNSNNGTHVGNGNSSVDIILEKNDKKIGIDIKCVRLKDNITNESALLQNFADVGQNLDTLFSMKKYNKITQLFQVSLHNKYNNIMAKYGINELAHLWIIYNNTKMYYVYFKLRPRRFQLKIQKLNDKSVNITGIFPDVNAKIYKSKKRVEVRLKKTVQKILLFSS